jgi:predicted small lipoprotein YifL
MGDLLEIHSLLSVPTCPTCRTRSLTRLALIGALAASFALAGCGRKGPLDPPPGASLDGATPVAQDKTLMSPIGVSPIGSAGTQADSGVGPNGQPQAPKGPKKHIPLDVLLN